MTTIFDPTWRSEVRIGKEGVASLLQGGSTPTLTLIDKETLISSGDLVYNSDSRYPYGLTIGKENNLRLTKDQLWREADLELPYDLNKVKLVLVLSE